MKKLIFLLIGMYCVLPGCKKDAPKFVTHTFTKQQWISGLTSVFSGMNLHLNNFTSTKHQYEQDDTYAYDDPTSSSLLIPSAGNVPLSFDLPVTRQDPYSIYINDVNSTRIATDAYSGYGYVTIYFESDGVEIHGDCVNNLICICGSPQLDLSDISTLIQLAFSPGNDGSASISSQNVSFTASIAESGPCVNNACAFLCDIFAPNRQSDMQTAIEKFIGDYVDQKSSIISTAFTQYLKSLGVSGPIIAIHVQDNGDMSVEDKE